MSTTTPSPPPISPPHEEPETDNHQPPHQPSVQSPTEYIDHQQHQFTYPNSPSLPTQPPQNSPEHHHQPPPPEEILNHQSPPPSPPPTETEQPPTETGQPPENFTPNHESPLPKQPLPSPLTPPAVPEDPSETTDYPINPNSTSAHESPISKQPPSSGPNDIIQSPTLLETPNPNPNLDHESPAKLEANPNPSPNQSPKNPSPSPPSSPVTTVTPPPPLGVPILHVATATCSPSKPVISPWTHQETANLIQAYQEKWYSLKKGPLKAGQWEEVAITVAARCGYDEPTKTAKQCRHKLEKLRKRYRAERGKPRSKANAWNFFKLMENLEKGPLPISSSPPMALVEYQKPSGSNAKKRKNVDEDENDDNDDDGEYLVNKRSSRAKNQSHSRHVPNGYLTRNLRFTEGGSRVVRGLRTPVVHKHRAFYKEEEEEEEEEEGGDNGGEEEGVAAQLAVEIKGFAEKFVKMENKKMEMIRDVERYRLEMENKRMEMIIESQQMLVETVNKAFSSTYETHKLSAN